MKRTASLSLLWLSACAASTSEARPTSAKQGVKPGDVQVSKAEPPATCQLKGTIDGGGLFVYTYDQQVRKLQERAAERGANYVVMDAVQRAGEIGARAFYCTAPAEACAPDCSPGFTCVSGTCVSTCNPPCADGQRCGADRSCHSGHELAPPTAPRSRRPLGLRSVGFSGGLPPVGAGRRARGPTARDQARLGERLAELVVAPVFAEVGLASDVDAAQALSHSSDNDAVRFMRAS
jgi:hypothetical protein